MVINGFRLKEAIKVQELRKESADRQFQDSVKKFKDEDKLSPDEAMAIFLDSEDRIAKLQTFQSKYNLQVEVTVLEKKMTLAEAVKRLGGAGRAEKMWRIASGEKKDRFESYHSDVRDKDSEVAKRTISIKDAMEKATKAANYAGALRAAIAKGNLTEIEMPDLDSSFLAG